MDTYTPIQGKAFREFVHYGHNVIVHPMLGRDLELLETYRYDLRLTEEKLENDGLTASELRQLTEEVRMKRVRMGLFRIMCCIDLPFLDANASPESRRPQVEAYIKQLPASEFGEFFQNVQEKLREMRHGLKSALIDGRIYLQIPEVRCEAALSVSAFQHHSYPIASRAGTSSLKTCACTMGKTWEASWPVP